jgi:predicted acyltransferase
MSKNMQENQPIRLQSADVYRGFVMLLMMAEVLHFQQVSEAIPESSFWKFMAHHQDHVSWIGCSLHDLIQPSFSFLVGLVLPYSILNRKSKGETFGKMVSHTIWRSIILISLGIFLRSQFNKSTYFTFEDTLSQIGLGYTFLFILGFLSFRIQLSAFILILVGYWLAFVFYPIPSADFNYESVGVAKDWQHLQSGFASHWNKNSNLAWAFDTWFLNLFPRENPFIANEGGYATLSFIPTLATMILGLFAGNILLSERSDNQKLKTFLILGISGLVVGSVLNYSGICPNVKRIWTPTWVIFSGGWCFLLMAFFYFVIDMKLQRKYSFILLFIGMNSIAAYVIAHTVDAYIAKSLYIHLGENYDTFLGLPYRTLIHGGLILLLEWLILRWMYQKKIFIRI